MAPPTTMPCEPWATEADICEPCASDYDGERLDEMLAAASRILYELSGRQWGGECETTVRPCSARGGRWSYGDGRHRPPTRDESGWCGCSVPDVCGCGGLSQIRLLYPVVEVSEVRVDGEIVDPAEYRVDDNRWLVRLPDSGGRHLAWPCCQDLSREATEERTFEVTYTHGRQPPPDGVLAASVLACELLKSCTPSLGECRLPKRVTTITRQGVTMALIDPLDFVKEGRTGLVEVDLFLAAARQGSTPGAVMSPDLPPYGRYTGT